MTAGGPPRFFALAVTPGGTFLAGSCGRGASRSDDGGRSWTPIAGPGDGVVHDLAVDRSGIVWAATASGLFRSGDDGRTWSGAALTGVTLYGIDAGDGLQVGTHGRGVASSDDGGRTWSFADDLDGVTVYRVVGDVAATEDRGVWRRSGDRWRIAGIDGRSVFALVDVGGGRLLAGTRGDGIHASADGGETWAPLASNLPDPVVHSLVADRRPGAVIAGTGAGPHRSFDGGTTWEPVDGAQLAHRRIFSLAVAGDGAVLAGSYDGVWRIASSGGDVQPLDTGLSPGEAFTIAVAPTGTAFAGTRSELLRSGDAGRSWEAVPAPGGAAVHAVAFAGDVVLAGTTDGVWSLSADSASWAPAGLQGHWVFSLLVLDGGRLLAGTIGDGAFAGDASRTWEATDLGAPMVYDFARTRGGALLAATGVVVDGAKTGGIHRSTDGGRTWSRTEAPALTVYRIVEDATGRLFAGGQRCAVLRSADGGRQWDLRRAVDEDRKMYSLAIDDGGALYLAAGDRLLRSDDAAESWHEVDDDALDGVTVYDLVQHPDGALLAATSTGPVRLDRD